VALPWDSGDKKEMKTKLLFCVSCVVCAFTHTIHGVLPWLTPSTLFVWISVGQEVVQKTPSEKESKYSRQPLKLLLPFQHNF
jgi:hypothetical protein